jgi:hypothetical protein
MTKDIREFDFVELARYYDQSEWCRWCKEYGADAFHHAISRGEPFTGSILNAVPLHNQECHLKIHGKLMVREQQEQFILNNIVYLLKKGYQFNELDKEFLIHHNLDHLLDVVKQMFP